MKLFASIYLVVGAFGSLAVAATPELNALAREIDRVESIREIKDVQRQFSQLAGSGRWKNMADLFSTNGTLIWGNETTTGQSSIQAWLKRDAGNMDGINPGSMNTVVSENPVVNLVVDGKSAKARWNGLRFSGDGRGGTKIQGGIYENEYVLTDKGWKLSLLHYNALYAGPYKGGWRNVGGGLPIIPYHFTPEGSGIVIPPAEGVAPSTNATVGQLAHRIARMNDEDEVRNLQHAYGYYVDRRMWPDVVDLFTPDAVYQIENVGRWDGPDEIRAGVEELMGPAGLTQGINNDHQIFSLIVNVDPNGKEAVARGIQISMLGNANTRAASWEFGVFRNHYVKEDGIWKIDVVDLVPVVVADYKEGWGNGGTGERPHYEHPFINITSSRRKDLKDLGNGTTTDLADLQRRLARSAAYDGAENQSHAYGYLLDDLDCARMGTLFAKRGHKASPFAGFFITPERVRDACFASYGMNRSALRNSISFHWRPQPVVLVSEDGRSATLRARLLQPSTSTTKAGSFNGAIYHDQMVLEDGKWRLWSVTIDEFYWESPSWEGGWSAANPRNKSEPDPAPAAWTKKYPPDISIAAVGDRESTFRDPEDVVPISQSSKWASASILLARMCTV
ncbi:SnoaL-like domain-containing protein [Lophiotrema nucula]|uniref:SnoaL-like domain-containing protein n=1 Tax=Lophiotrema nucula TaxID=690887 RepID=A0A6A5ZHQ7_9PLEO|nr:SnoaL-like domain-containing protein [Lophiotrema nucula]